MSDFADKRYYIVNLADPDPNTKKFGPYTLGDEPIVPGVGPVRVQDPVPGEPDNHFRAITEAGPQPTERFTDTRAWRLAEQDVLVTYTADPLSPDEAATLKRKELTARWNTAVAGGIPYSVALNGDTLHALLRYDLIDQYVWAAHEYGMPAPPGGLLVALQVPIDAPGKPYDGDSTFAITGQPRLDGAKLAIRDHINTASLAWQAGQTDIQAILDSADPDATKVANIQAIDVETYSWPSNDVPTS